MVHPPLEDRDGFNESLDGSARRGGDHVCARTCTGHRYWRATGWSCTKSDFLLASRHLGFDRLQAALLSVAERGGRLGEETARLPVGVTRG
jgi:hypothetical protein